MSVAVEHFPAPLAWLQHFTQRIGHIFTLPIVIGIAAVVPYTSLVTSGSMVLADSPYSDYLSFQVPMREFVRSELLAGRFPHWNPWVGCGMPMHATQQTGICYPLSTPLLLIMSANMATKFAMLLHIILCYAGQYQLARALGISRAGAAIGGLIIAQNGFLTCHLAVGHVALVFACSLLPWLLLTVVLICRGLSWRATAGFAAVVAGLLLVGHPQVPFYGLLAGGTWAASSLLFGAASKHRLRTISQFVIGLAIAIMIASVQLLPTLELIKDNAGLSNRGTAEYAGLYSLDLVDLYRLLVPSLRGSPLTSIPEFEPPDFYHERVCYIGLLSWGLILASFTATKSNKWQVGAALLALGGLGVAVGRATMAFDALGSVVPGLFLFRCPGRCMSIIAVLQALLAARGFDALFDNSGSSQRSTWGIILALLAFDGAAAYVLDRSLAAFNWNRWMHFAMEHLQPDLHATGIMVILTVSFLLWGHHLSERARLMMATLILLTDLGYFNMRGVRFELDDLQSLPISVQADSTQYRFIEVPQFPAISQDLVRYSRHVPQAVRSHVRMIGTNEGGMLPRSVEMIYRDLEREPVRMLHEASCRNVVKGAQGGGWITIGKPLPRIRFTSPSQADSTANLKILTDEPQTLEIEVTTPSDGMLVVADSYYPGWRATIDDTQVQVQRHGNSFRKVAVGAGTHLVRMTFSSDSFAKGSLLAAIGTLALIGLLFLDRWSAGRNSEFVDDVAEGNQELMPCDPTSTAEPDTGSPW